MKKLQTLICAGLFALSGCIFDKKPVDTKNLDLTDLEKGPEMVDYFSEIPPAFGESSPTTIAGDFDGDGDLDYITTQSDVQDSIVKTRSYFSENDGKGNFKLRQYEKKK